MKSPTQHKEGIVAVLDALGAAAYGETEIVRFMQSRAIVLSLARQKAKDTLDAKRLKVFTFNDTIVFALERAPSKPLVKQYSAFFLLLRKFMLDSFRSGILFRGSIAIGSFFADDASNTVMGEAITDAAAWYSKANWIGINATPRASILLDGCLEKAKQSRTYAMLDYDVPMKSGPPIKLKTVNWPKAFFTPSISLPEENVDPRGCMLDYIGAHSIPQGAEDKCFNAITFFDHVVSELQLTPKED